MKSHSIIISLIIIVLAYSLADAKYSGGTVILQPGQFSLQPGQSGEDSHARWTVPYTVVVGNAFGAVTSFAASLDVFETMLNVSPGMLSGSMDFFRAPPVLAFGEPLPYGVTNNLDDYGWIWADGSYLIVEFLSPVAMTGLRVYCVYDEGERGSQWVIEHSSDKLSWLHVADFTYWERFGAGVDDAGSPMTGTGGWYSVAFNKDGDRALYWRIRQTKTLRYHAPRSAEMEFYGIPPSDTAPSLSRQPKSQTVLSESPITFRVQAWGTTPLRYQWRFNGTPLPSETTNILSLSQAQIADAGNYDVVVTNDYGSVTSRVVVLTVLPPGYSGGTGEPNDPYRIATAFDLIALGQAPQDYDKHFIMMTDIDLDPNLPGRMVFDRGVIAPGSTTPFNGVFDGNGHVISHMTIKGWGWYLGLFGPLGARAVIRDLGVVDVHVTGSGEGSTGALAGRNDGAVTSCYSTGVVSGSSSVGGLVGGNGGTISDCYSTGDVNGTGWDVGGLVGVNGSGTIRNCYSTGDVNGDGSVGGLVGGNYGNISDCYSTGDVIGVDEGVGGLVGSTSGTIFNCYSTSDVSGGIWVGGLVGLNMGLISNCYFTGDVSGYHDVGGLVGHNGMGCEGCLPPPGYIIDSYSIGSVQGNSSVGGLVGYNEVGDIVRSFWDIQTSGMNTSSGGTGKTTAEMKTMSTFTDAGWDFFEIWLINDRATYPVLRKEIHSDLNGDGIVNMLDFAIFASHWLEPLEPEECFPRCSYAYINWITFGRPVCWCCPTQCYGDANCDGFVDDSDLGLITPKIGTTYHSPMYDPCVDFNHDGYIGDGDLYILIVERYGTEPPDDCLTCP